MPPEVSIQVRLRPTMLSDLDDVLAIENAAVYRPFIAIQVAMAREVVA